MRGGCTKAVLGDTQLYTAQISQALGLLAEQRRVYPHLETAKAHPGHIRHHAIGTHDEGLVHQLDLFGQPGIHRTLDQTGAVGPVISADEFD